MSDNERKEQKVYQLPIEWHYPEGLKTGYATNFIVQHTEHEFYLSFFDFPPPILLGSEEQKLEQLERLESVRPSAIARIAMTPDRMEELIEMLQDNLSKYREKHSGAEEE